MYKLFTTKTDKKAYELTIIGLQQLFVGICSLYVYLDPELAHSNVKKCFMF